MPTPKPLMDVNSLFTQALGMVNPWKVVELKFDAAGSRPDKHDSIDT